MTTGESSTCREIRFIDTTGMTPHGEPFHQVLEFADVTGPVACHESGKGSRRFPGMASRAAPSRRMKLSRNNGTSSPLPERYLDVEDIQPIEKIGAELALGDSIGEIAVGRGDHTDVGPA